MSKQQGPDGEQVASISDGALQLDMSVIDARRLMAVVAGHEPSPLESGRYFVELEGGRVHRLSLAENPPAGEYTVVVFDPEEPGRPPWVSRIQVRDIRG